MTVDAPATHPRQDAPAVWTGPDELRPLLRPVDDLTPLPGNPRRGDVDAVARSLARFGQRKPVTIRPDGTVTAGNHTRAAAIQLGWTHVAAVAIDEDDASAKAWALADNRTSDLATNDDEDLAAMLAEIQAADADLLAATSYTDDDLEALLALVNPPERKPFGDPEAAPTTSPERCELGQVWQLGRHRLAVGDAAGDLDVRGALLEGYTPTVAYMDPPYGMRLQTDYKAMHHDERLGRDPKWGTSNTFAPVHGDDADFDAGPLVEAFAACREQWWWGADYYRDTIPTGGSWLVWDKRSLDSAGEDGEGMFDNVIGNQFELCWSRRPHRRELLRHVWSGLHGVHGDSEVHRRVHPTQKPVALHRSIFAKWCEPGDVVVDLYAGSGSTLVACEVEGLACLTAELVPTYADVVLARWEQLTGETARLVP